MTTAGGAGGAQARADQDRLEKVGNLKYWERVETEGNNGPGKVIGPDNKNLISRFDCLLLLRGEPGFIN